MALLRFLAASGLGARVTAATNRADAYNGFSAWTPVRQPGCDRRERPGRAGKSVKWNSLLCNLIVFHIAIDMMEVQMSVADTRRHAQAADRHRPAGRRDERLARTSHFAATVFAINPAVPIDWGNLAGGAGYFDPAHFGHVFRAFTGSRAPGTSKSGGGSCANIPATR